LKNHSILVVDDIPEVKTYLVDALSPNHFVKGVTTGKEALELIRREHFDMLITDIQMPEMSGEQLISEVNKLGLDMVIVAVTAYGSIEDARKIFHLGVYDYITKPFELEKLKLTIKNGLDSYDLRQENKVLHIQLEDSFKTRSIIGNSVPLQRIRDRIRQVASTRATILITGESGTGKELAAREIHTFSDRRNKPYITVNCASIPETLLESELFGHERGAFTHAVRTRIGRFEQAHGGSVFLDEISEMSPGLQVKILRVLQDHSFERIGGLKTIRVDIRVIAATNRDLEELVRQNKFREDLFYRLNVIPIRVPPLRERDADIILLAQHFLQLFSRTKKKPLKRLSPAALERLSQYPWPGNVRELENLMERLVILTEGETIEIADLPEKFQHLTLPPPEAAASLPPRGVHFTEMVQAFERNLILSALRQTNWVKSQAAQLLHLNRTTLLEKMKKQNLTAGPETTPRPEGSSKDSAS
jgi:DNA-binding NtrC family response regulator